MKSELFQIVAAAVNAQHDLARQEDADRSWFSRHMNREEAKYAVLEAAIAWSRHIGTVSEGSESYSRAKHNLLDAVEAYTHHDLQSGA